MNTSPTRPGPVHLDTALALSQIGDAEAMQGMLVMLEDTLASDVPKITDLLLQGDVAGASHILHPLKGFIPIFCNAALCDHVSQVELLSKSADSAAVSAAYAALRPKLEQLLAEVAVYLADGAQGGASNAPSGR